MILIMSEGFEDVRVRPMYPQEDETAHGLFYTQPLEIAIEPSLTPEEQAPVLIHEIIHAIWASRNMAKRVTEESACTQLGVAFAEIIRDNAWLMPALTQALTEGKPIV